MRFAPLATGFLWATLLAPPAVAFPVQYVFSSTCSSNATQCGLFGLSTGSPVSATITVDSAEISPGATVVYPSALPPGDSVSASFGTVSLNTLTNASLFTPYPEGFSFTFSADTNSLSCVGYAFNIGGGNVIGCPNPTIAMLQTAADSQGFPFVQLETNRITAADVFPSQGEQFASAVGSFVRVVPEPTTATLIGFGFVILARARRPRC